MEFYKIRNRYTSLNKVLKAKNLKPAPDCQPPAANRGVQKPKENTAVQTINFDELCCVDYNGMLASIDWLEFTVFNMDYVFVVQNVLGLSLSDFKDSGRGASGYPVKMEAVKRCITFPWHYILIPINGILLTNQRIIL